jgi:protein mraZ
VHQPFTGTFKLRLDDKGRLTLPAKYREHFEQGVMVAKVQEGCLAVYTLEEFQALVARWTARVSTERELRAFQRWLGAGTSDNPMDRSGRVLVPEDLRAHAGLDREVVMVGGTDRLEIWDPQRWAVAAAELDEMFS